MLVSLRINLELHIPYWTNSFACHLSIHSVPIHSVQRHNWLLIGLDLSWFQTSLPLTTLLLHRPITACRFRVAALSGHAALAFPPSDITLKLNWSQLSVVCHCGQSGEVINWLAWHCSPLGLSASFLNGEWRLRNRTKITIEAALSKMLKPDRLKAYKACW